MIRSEVRLVLLDVSVKDHDGGFADGLDKDNFQVLENNVVQPITTFSSHDLPVTMGLIIDESRSMTPKRNDVLSAAGILIAESNPQDEIFVLNFNDSVRRGLPEGTLFSDDIDQLRAALDRGVPQGRTALNDAVVEGLAQLEQGTRSKKALVLISDGGDNASRHTRRDLMDRLERSTTTVYTVGLFDKGDPDRNEAFSSRLPTLAAATPTFRTPHRKWETCAAALREISGKRYTLGYVPAPRNGGTLRHIRVTVSAPGHPKLTAHTRTSYRYDETPEQTSR